jgi:hypothetical protein
MRQHQIAIIVVGLIFGAPAAKADWEYTNWGMTPEQVIKASHGLAEKIMPLSREYRQRGKWVRSTHKSGELAYNVVFRFELNSKGLDRVQLTLNDLNKCGSLAPLLKTRYGDLKAKVMAPGWRRFTWKDDKSNSRIRFTEGRNGGSLVSCGIEYSPLGSRRR